MRVKFEAQLERLNVELITMGALCEEVISGAAKALLDGDSGLRETVLAAERDINQKERDIESLCMKLLLQQQPVARDLRTISSALKMISDMERIGDQAADQKHNHHNQLHGLFGPEGAPAGDAGMLFFHSTQPFLVDSVSSADTRARGPCLCVN